MNVSIIIPAYNVSATLAEAVESVLAQTFVDWEAIIVDDGSSDDTVVVAERFAKRDGRIRVVRQPHQGVSAARNIGIGLARYEWLLFLDADDWILPRHLERLTGKLSTNSELDGVYCWYCRVAADGTLVEEEHCRQEGDLFPVFARRCIFAIHTCIVRRALVTEVGGFDRSLDCCVDWDLWQRIARTGAQFGVVCEILAYYRMRPRSLSVDGFRMLTGFLRIMQLGESSDPRVPTPTPAYASGLPEGCPPENQLLAACWAASMLLGQGQDAIPLLSLLKEVHAPDLSPYYVAKTIFLTALFPSSRAPASWLELWPTIETRVHEFLSALEMQAQAAGLARRTQMHLERMILECSDAPKPVAVGAFHALCAEITEPIPDASLAAAIERLYCIVTMQGERLGVVELPVCDGFIPSAVLADAIAAEFAWPILGSFFGATTYQTLDVKREPTGLSLWRGALCLAEALPEAAQQQFHSHLHDQCGWTVFLQEVWARPDWRGARFYDLQKEQGAAPLRQVSDGWLVAEVSQEIPDVETAAPVLNVVLTIGGVAIGVVPIPVQDQCVSAQEIRANLVTASGFELCRAVVREGVLGRPLTEPPALRTRLAEAALAQHGPNDPTSEESASLMLTINGTPRGNAAAPSPAPGSAGVLNQALAANPFSLVLGRRDPTMMGTSASRRAVFPVAAAPMLLTAASVTGEPAILTSPSGKQPEQIMYRPDFIWRSLRRPRITLSSGNAEARSAGATRTNRAYFEQLFAGQVDPWNYTSPYEQMKYEHTLSLLPRGRIAHALELACAEGHFTAQLAPRVERLIATDISQIALERAAERCANWQNVSFMRFDFTEEPLLGRFSLIVCSEVLYYVSGRTELQAVAENFAEALELGGYLLMAHANVIVDEPDQAGFDWSVPFGAKTIGETFAALASLRLVKELRTPLYRVQLFQRVSDSSSPDRAPEKITLNVQPTSLLPEVAAYVLWNGGTVQPSALQPVTTQRLPILMYHRVAPTGVSATQRYRVTPAVFEEQLKYLHSAGYYSVSLEGWRIAKEEKKPLPGRAVLITFDDGYQDFFSYAWPLLRRYGFSATIFLVTNEIGGTNTWDAPFGETVRLLSWPEIQQLQKEGVEFGSHSEGHRPLTALTPAEIVHEGIRSRATLENVLGVPVRAFAYPYGDTDQVVQHLIGACGYSFGLSFQPGLSRVQDSLLALPRVEVVGTEGLRAFIAKLNS